jgi:ankyrin repeat protein
MVKVLSGAGADPNRRDNEGKSPLHEAAHLGHADTARGLLKAGAETGVTDNFGDTPLDLAQKSGYENVASLIQDGDFGDE